MRGGVIEGLDGRGEPKAVRVNRDGLLMAEEQGEDGRLDELILEMRGVRIGLEILNGLKIGELLKMASQR